MSKSLRLILLATIFVITVIFLPLWAWFVNHPNQIQIAIFGWAVFGSSVVVLGGYSTKI